MAERAGGVLTRRPVDANGVPAGSATPVHHHQHHQLVGHPRRVLPQRHGVLRLLADGRLYARTFNPANGALGTARAINMYDDPDNGTRIPFAINSLTGMFYDPATHRLYYTVSNDARLFYRYFTPQSEILGAQTFTAASSVNFSTAAGLTLANNGVQQPRVFFGSTSDGGLRSAQLG